MKQVLIPVCAATFLSLINVATVVDAATPSLEARKELNAIGVRYDDASELMKATRQKNWELIKLLLDAKGVTINTNHKGETPLDLAIKGKDRESIRFVLDNGGVPAPQHIERAVAYKDIDLLDTLINAPSFNKMGIGTGAVRAAIDNRDELMLRRLFTLLGNEAVRVANASGGLGDAKSKRLLNYAIYQSAEPSILKVLIDFGADVNVVDPEMSMTSGNVLVILSAPRRPYKTPMTPLMLAAARHDLPALRVLIESGAEINKVVVQEEQILGITVRETALSQAQKFNELREFRGMGRKEAVIQYLEEAGAKRPSDL